MTVPPPEKTKDTDPAAPRDAATVIVLRERRQKPFEIFLMRRRRSQSFMGGASVFPGGALDKNDCDPELIRYIQGLTGEQAKNRLQEPDIPAETALGLFLAAVRETFEESGILAAYGPSGRLLDFSDGETAGRFAGYRLQLHKHTLNLKDLAQKENLRYALDLLTPYSHWITPTIEPKRFDTRFFLLRQPPGQIPIHDTIELSESKWLSPRAALEQYQKDEILLMPPTFKTIEELEAFPDIAQLIDSARSHPIDPILPEIFTFEDGFGIKLPHDPEYGIAAYKQPSRPEAPSRVVMKNNRLQTVFASHLQFGCD